MRCFKIIPMCSLKVFGGSTENPLKLRLAQMKTFKVVLLRIFLSQPAFPRWTHLIFQSFKSSPGWSASLPQRWFLVGTRRADDCRKKSAIWSSASLLKADKWDKNLSSNPTGDGYQAVNQTLSSEMSWTSFHLRNILNRREIFSTDIWEIFSTGI